MKPIGAFVNLPALPPDTSRFLLLVYLGPVGYVILYFRLWFTLLLLTTDSKGSFTFARNLFKTYVVLCVTVARRVTTPLFYFNLQNTTGDIARTS